MRLTASKAQEKTRAGTPAIAFDSVLAIQGAIKARQPSVELMGRTVKVDCNAGIFVTMNPAGKGYGGRSKLPDNLKALFRSVAMTLPDNEIIAEVLLLSSGFATAKELGRLASHLHLNTSHAM